MKREHKSWLACTTVRVTRPQDWWAVHKGGETLEDHVERVAQQDREVLARKHLAVLMGKREAV